LGGDKVDGGSEGGGGRKRNAELEKRLKVLEAKVIKKKHNFEEFREECRRGWNMLKRR